MADRIGEQFGNYRLVRLLGEGGFAEVYLGEHIYMGTQAAIKLLSMRVTQDDIGQFQQEARLLANLIHPHVVRVLEFGVEDRTPYLVMDYAPGGSLRTRHPKGSQLPLPTVVEYIQQAAQALQYAHDRKLIHRDVKPENMLIGRRGEILLSDFGIALIAQSSRYQSTKDMAGTIAYMAPEQIEAHPRSASDQYSLGIVAYEWLSGTRPFQGSFTEIAIKHAVTPPPSLLVQVSTLPTEVEQVIFRALAKKPEERFASVSAFATALTQASTDATIRTSYPGVSSPSAQLAMNTPILPPDSAIIPLNLPAQTTLPVSITPPASLTSTPAQSPSPAAKHPPSSQPLQDTPRSLIRDSDLIGSQGDPPPAVPSAIEEHASGPEPLAGFRRRSLAPDNLMTTRQDDRVTPHRLPKEDAVVFPSVNRAHIQAASLRKTVPFLALSFLLVLGGLGLYHVVSVDRANSLAAAIATATATAEARATAGAQGDLTATAQPAVTATAQAFATATAAQGIYHQFTSGTPAMSDPLSDDRNSWGVFTTNWGGQCAFTGGAYHLTLSQPGYVLFCTCANLAKLSNYTNFAVQVQLRIAQGDEGGIVFDQTTRGAYRIDVVSTGRYVLYQHTPGMRTLQDGFSPVIKTGLNQSNILTVIVSNGNFYFYVNSQFVTSYNIGSSSSGGGDLAAQSDVAATDAVFSNLKIWTL